MHDPEKYYEALDRYVEGKREEQQRRDEQITEEAERMKTFYLSCGSPAKVQSVELTYS